jgi:hypothetical protein
LPLQQPGQLVVVLQTHIATEHAVPAPQPASQPPQWFASVWMSTQALPHWLGVGEEQLIAQLVPSHIASPMPDVGPEHGEQVGLLPQPFDGAGSSHVLPQRIVPGEQPPSAGMPPSASATYPVSTHPLSSD